MPLVGRFINYHLNGFLRAAMHMTTVRPLAPEVKAAYLYPHRRLQDRESIDAFVKDIPFHPSHPSYPVICKTDEGLRQFRDDQVLLLWGMRDFCFSPYFLEQWLERFPVAFRLTFEDAGHFLFEEKAQDCVPALRKHFELHQFSSKAGKPA
jgi:haloalkane dehalogenase